MTLPPFVVEPPAEQTLYNAMEREISEERAAQRRDNYQPDVHVTRLYTEKTGQDEKTSKPHVRREKVKKALKWPHRPH